MGAHLLADGQFQSDKYPWCQRGFVPLKVTDPDAQPLLWAYAQAHRARDIEFSDDLEAALIAEGYVPKPRRVSPLAAVAKLVADAFTSDLVLTVSGRELEDRLAALREALRGVI